MAERRGKGPPPRGGRIKGLRPLKRLSQNFLVDPEAARRIVDLARIGPADTVIEVGPGHGALTRLLLERAGKLIAVELDRKLSDLLGVELASEPKLVLHQGDILAVRIRDWIPEGKAVVVGNLPYAITSELVLWLLDQHEAVRRATVLMQREVARRLTAPPGSREAGSLTLALQYRAEVERLLDLPPSVFRPAPQVTSSLVAIRFREHPAVAPRHEGVFFRVIRAAFGERRKTLPNALAAGLAIPRGEALEAVRAAGLDPRVRGERLGLDDFRRLADLLLDRGLPGFPPGSEGKGAAPAATSEGSGA
jgi:16S rRNA (adenine1518-N6/adenine1519-N6)-dimethyltransferase